MNVLGVFLILFSFGAMAFGVLNVSEATLGVFLAAVGCWFAILARIAQADHHHAKRG
jgi:hypothetical protein